MKICDVDYIQKIIYKNFFSAIFIFKILNKTAQSSFLHTCRLRALVVYRLTDKVQVLSFRLAI